MSVYFDESFVGGFFGFRRTYGAVARIETESPATLKRDWLDALAEVSRWRDERGAKATAVHFIFVVPVAIANETRSFVGEMLLAPLKLPTELAGLKIVDAAVFDPDGGLPFEATIRKA